MRFYTRFIDFIFVNIEVPHLCIRLGTKRLSIQLFLTVSEQMWHSGKATLSLYRLRYDTDENEWVSNWIKHIPILGRSNSITKLSGYRLAKITVKKPGYLSQGEDFVIAHKTDLHTLNLQDDLDYFIQGNIITYTNQELIYAFCKAYGYSVVRVHGM